jgi:serine/threonine protein kinase
MAAHTLGRFEILEQLGCSDLVTVFKAHDPRLDRTLVLRAMRLEAPEPQSAARLARFREEAARAATLESPNIVELYETGEADGMFYAAMECVSGSRLRDLEKPLSNSDLLDISRQVCTALDHAHSHGVIASNIKPSNVMVEWDGAVKLMDFGISESTGADTDEVLAYLSPEQINGEAPGVRSNIFSWAAILYEMATGRRAFAGKGDAVCQVILHDQPKPPSESNPELPDGISRVILKALSRAPAERYGSGAEMLHELEAHKAGGRAPAPAVPFMLQAHARSASVPTPSAKLSATRPSPRITAVQVRSTVSPPTAAASAEGVRTRDTAIAPQLSTTSIAPMTSQEAPGVAPPAPAVAQPSAPAASQPTVPRQPARPAISAQSVRLAIPPNRQSAAPSSGPTPDGKIGPWSNLNTRLLVYAMAAVIVALLAVIVFGAVSSHNNKVAATPQPVAPNDPDFSQPTSAPQPVPAPSSAPVTFEIRNAPARSQHRLRQPLVTSVKVPMTGEVVVQTAPAGAQVQLDGRSDVSWVTPCVISGVQPGQHAVVLSKPGYAQVSRAFQVLAGNRTQVSLGLAELGAALAITSNPPGAAISIDGRDTGRVTPAQLVVPGGAHKVTVQKAGYLAASANAEVTPGQVFRFDPQLKITGDPEEARNASKMTKLFGKGTPEGMGRLQVRTNPRGAWITLNNHVLDRATPADFFLPPGSYEMKLTLTGYKDLERVITIERDSKLVVDETLHQ